MLVALIMCIDPQLRVHYIHRANLADTCLDSASFATFEEVECPTQPPSTPNDGPQTSLAKVFHQVTQDQIKMLLLHREETLRLLSHSLMIRGAKVDEVVSGCLEVWSDDEGGKTRSG